MPSKDREMLGTHVKKAVYEKFVEKAKGENLSNSEALRRLAVKYVEGGSDEKNESKMLVDTHK